MNIKNYISAVVAGTKRIVVKHSPELMLGLGIGAAFAAVITAVSATPKALRSIEEEKKRNETTELSVKDTVKATWKYYIPTAVLFASSMACLIGGHSIASKRTAAIAAAASVTETALRQYKDAIAESVAPDVKEKIEEAVSAKQVQRAADPRDAQVYISDKEGVLCYEPQSGRYFRSTRESIKGAVNDLNHDMLCDGFEGSVSLNDFYDKIGLPDTEAGAALGWNTSNGLVEIIFSSQLAPDGTPCLVIRYDKPPVYNFDRAFVY